MPTRLARAAQSTRQGLTDASSRSLLVKIFPHAALSAERDNRPSHRPALISLIREEAQSRIKVLEEALADVERRIGILMGQPIPTCLESSSRRSVNHMVGTMYTSLTMRSEYVPASELRLPTEMQLILAHAVSNLASQQERTDTVLAAYGRPSLLVRLWPVALLGPPSALLLVRSLWRSRATFRDWFDVARDTARGFVIDWVLEPCLKILETVRHGDSTLSIMSKESLDSDLASLKRMVTDFSRDQKTYSDAQIQEISQRVALGDMTPVLTVFEEDIRTPVRSTVTGSLLRTLLIQVQKVKVDVALAMDGIEKMLRSQQLTFAFVGVAPSILIVYALKGAVSWLWPATTRERVGAKRARRQAWSAVRTIDRILHEDGDLSIKSATGQRRLGRLLVQTSHLRKYAMIQLKGDLRAEYLLDVRDIEEGSDKVRALDRLWRSWHGSSAL